MFILILVTGIATFVRNFAIVVAAERIVAALRKRLFQNLIAQEIGFFDTSRTGDLSNRLFADTVCTIILVTL